MRTKLISVPVRIALIRFSLRHKSQNTGMLLRSAISVLPDLKAVFDSVNRAILWRTLSLKDVSEKFISLI